MAHLPKGQQGKDRRPAYDIASQHRQEEIERRLGRGEQTLHHQKRHLHGARDDMREIPRRNQPCEGHDDEEAKPVRLWQHPDNRGHQQPCGDRALKRLAGRKAGCVA